MVARKKESKSKVDPTPAEVEQIDDDDDVVECLDDDKGDAVKEAAEAEEADEADDTNEEEQDEEAKDSEKSKEEEETKEDEGEKSKDDEEETKDDEETKGDEEETKDDDEEVVEDKDVVEDSNDVVDITEETKTPSETKSKKKDEDDVITVDDSIDIDIAPKVVSDTEFYENVSEEEKAFYAESGVDPESIEAMSICCTACTKQVNHHQTNSIQRHPVLGVPVCRHCKYFYEDDGEWEKDENGSDSYCRWCANGGEMLCCDKCSNAFCKRCIMSNLGRKKYNQINDLVKWECFLCNPKPIYSQRALMRSISKWYVLRKEKKKLKEKEAKVKVTKKIVVEKQKKTEAELSKVENFIDENINEAFDTLKIYQKCLEDERRRWVRNKKTMTPDSCAAMAVKLRKIYGITKQNMDLLDTALVQGYLDKFPGETPDKIKTAKMVTGSPKGKKMIKIGPNKSTPTSNKCTPSSSNVSATNGVASVNKRKMKDTTKSPIVKKSKPSGDDDIAVEEIIVNGDAILGNQDFFDPSQLCSIQITGVSTPPAPPRIPPVKRPTGPLRLSNKMFKKKTPNKPQRPSTPDSDIEEITIIDDNDKVESDVDSDVSLDC